jgi:alcohol dehydrogenase class IV
MAALAHAMGHALGATFHTPHGRAVSLFLPYSIEFNTNGGGTRYADIAYHLRLPARDETEGASSLVTAIRQLQQELSQPASLRELGIELEAFEQALPQLTANAESDTSLVMNTRIPSNAELERLFRCAYHGTSVDF